MGCFGSSNEAKQPLQAPKVRQEEKPIPPPKVSKLEEIDLIKGKLKGTRDKIDNLVSQHERELASIDK